jgi:hypothetical protein
MTQKRGSSNGKVSSKAVRLWEPATRITARRSETPVPMAKYRHPIAIARRTVVAVIEGTGDSDRRWTPADIGSP